jgi:hypothetical protein
MVRKFEDIYDDLRSYDKFEVFERFVQGYTYDARVVEFMSFKRASEGCDAIRKRVKKFSDFVRAKDDFRLLEGSGFTRARGAIIQARRHLKVKNLKLRILNNKFYKKLENANENSRTVTRKDFESITKRHLKSLNPKKDVSPVIVNKIVSLFVDQGYYKNRINRNLNRANNANTRKNIGWKNVRLNSLNNKNDSIGGTTFNVGNKAVRLWRNYYVSLRTLRGLTKKNASNVFNLNQNDTVSKNPWTRNNILRKNIEFVQFV